MVFMSTNINYEMDSKLSEIPTSDKDSLIQQEAQRNTKLQEFSLIPERVVQNNINIR